MDWISLDVLEAYLGHLGLRKQRVRVQEASQSFWASPFETKLVRRNLASGILRCRDCSWGGQHHFIFEVERAHMNVGREMREDDRPRLFRTVEVEQSSMFDDSHRQVCRGVAT